MSFCASFNACTPDVVDLLRQNRVLAHAHRHGDGAAGQQPDRSLPRQHQVARGGGELAVPRLRVVPAVHPGRGRRGLVSPAGARRGAELASSAAASSSRPTVDVATERGSFIPPEQRFYAGGPNDVRGFKRNELGPVVYVVSKGEVDSAAAAPAGTINPDSVQVSATGGNTLAVGNVELRVPSPVFGSRLRLAAFVDAGGAWQRGDRRSR